MSSLLPYLFLLLLLLIPSSGLQQFDGLPLSHWVEFLGLALLLPFLFSRSLRQKAADLFSKVRFSLPLFFAAGMIVLLLKVVLFIFSPRDGFIGCYSSPAPWASSYQGTGPSFACERSYEDLFHRSGATRVDRTISFNPDSWNLTFLNSLRYDYPVSDGSSIPRDRIPITASWTGSVAPEQAGRVILRYTGEGQLAVGSRLTPLPPAYDRVNEISLDLPAGKQNFLLQYFFDDGSRVGQADATWGPGAQITVALSGSSGEQPLRVMPPGLPWTIAAGGADILFALLLIVPLIAFVSGVWPDRWIVLALAAFLAVCYFLPLSQRVRGLGTTAGLMGFWLWHCLRKPIQPIAIFSVLLAVSLVNNLLLLPNPSQVVLRSAQDDPLTLESHAYSILSSGSLEAGEKVFFAQPMYRYIKFGEHALFGDGATFYCAVELALFFGGAFFLLESALRRGLSQRRRWLLAGIGSAFFFLGGYYVSIVIRNGLSEYLTWSLLLWILPLLFFRETPAARFFCLVALAFSFTVRTNQAIAILCLMLFAFHGLWKQNKKAFIGGVVATGFILLLPLFHNLYYGHEFVVATSSVAVPQNLPVPPAVWIASLHGDASAAAAVYGHLKMLFLIVDVTFSTRLTLAAMGFCFLMWFPIFLYTMIRRRAFECLLLSVPLLYLAPHLFFDVRIYYPRLFFIGYLSMAAVAVVWLALGKREHSENSIMASKAQDGDNNG